MKKTRSFAVEADVEVIAQIRKRLQCLKGVSVQDVTAEVMTLRHNERIHEWRRSLEEVTDDFLTA